MNTTITKSKNSSLYKQALRIFRKQYRDVKEIRKLFVNSDHAVYAGEWIDHAGTTHFNSGYLPDLYRTIVFIP